MATNSFQSAKARAMARARKRAWHFDFVDGDSPIFYPNAASREDAIRTIARMTPEQDSALLEAYGTWKGSIFDDRIVVCVTLYADGDYDFELAESNLNRLYCFDYHSYGDGEW